MRGERWIGEEIVKHKEPELGDLGNSQPIHIPKMGNLVLKGMVEQPFDKEITINHEFNQKPGIEM